MTTLYHNTPWGQAPTEDARRRCGSCGEASIVHSGGETRQAETLTTGT